MPSGVYPRTKVNILERIERHLGTMAEDECWITDYTPNGMGYTYTVNDGGTRVALHRVAWEAHNAQPIPEGMVVLHTCDNPLCINPQHLTVGTQADNMYDCIDKGRHGWLTCS